MSLGCVTEVLWVDFGVKAMAERSHVTVLYFSDLIRLSVGI